MDRESLLIILRKIKRFLVKTPKITSTVFLIIILSVISVFAKDSNLEQRSIAVEPKLKHISIPTPISTPTAMITTPAPKIVEGKEGVSQSVNSNSSSAVSSPTLAESKTVLDVSQGDSDLLSAINKFRNANGVSSLGSSTNLCQVAEKRLEELIANGSLDNHAGFDKYFKGQTEFKGMGENLHWANYSETAAEVVENGWEKSPGHLANMLDSKWQYGCGRQAGTYFATFIFGSK